MKKGRNVRCWHVKAMIVLVGLLILATVPRGMEETLASNPSTTEREPLPYYLDGTILDGSLKVIMAVDPTNPRYKPPKEMLPDNCDSVISYKEMQEIIENARGEYIDKYGVDPCQPDEAGPPEGLSLREAYELFLELEGDNPPDKPIDEYGQFGGSDDDPPWQISGEIVPKVFWATDPDHEPEPNEWLNPLIDVMERFESEFYPVDPWPIYLYFGYWWAGDVGDKYDIGDLWIDLKQDVAQYLYDDNEFAIGIVKKADHNGIVWGDHRFSVCADERIDGADWPHDSIVQHEVSHQFDATEGGYWFWEHEECIMNYFWAWWGTNRWCDDHWLEVFVGIWWNP